MKHLIAAALITLPVMAFSKTLPECQVTDGVCNYQDPQLGELQLVIDPVEPAPMKPVRFILQAKGQSGEIVSRSEGVKMFMGYTDIKFKKFGDQYQGEGVFPKCHNKKMGWKMNVTLNHQGEEIIWPVKFFMIQK